MLKTAKTVTHRGFSKAPPELQFWIDLVNADCGRELPHANPVERLERAFDGGDDAESYKRGSIKLNSEISASLSVTARKFLGPVTGFEFPDRYDRLISARETLTRLAERSRGGQFRHEHAVSVSVALRDNEEGLLKPVFDDGLLSALTGVRADRIRACAVCKRIFWALRANSECCSERCRKTYNQRISRAERRRRASKKRRPPQAGR